MTTLDDVYTERNRCVALIARMALQLGYPAYIALHDGVDWDDDWRNVIFIELPNGQISWHIHDSELFLFAFLPYAPSTWDKHTTEEKYTRIAAYALYSDTLHNAPVRPQEARTAPLTTSLSIDMSKTPWSLTQ